MVAVSFSSSKLVDEEHSNDSATATSTDQQKEAYPWSLAVWAVGSLWVKEQLILTSTLFTNQTWQTRPSSNDSDASFNDTSAVEQALSDVKLDVQCVRDWASSTLEQCLAVEKRFFLKLQSESPVWIVVQCTLTTMFRDHNDNHDKECRVVQARFALRVLVRPYEQSVAVEADSRH